MPVSSSFGSASSQRIVVSVGDLAAVAGHGNLLSTYALGSCVGLVFFDPERCVSAMLHFMLPDSALSSEKAQKRPAMFADTGIEAALAAMRDLGADVGGLKVFLAGGAALLTSSSHFKIGDKNIAAARKILKEKGISISLEEVGGVNNRTLSFSASNAEISIKTPVGTNKITL